MKTSSLIFFTLLSTTAIGKYYPEVGYQNYTLGTTGNLVNDSITVPANLGDSVKLSGYYMVMDDPQAGDWYFNGNPIPCAGCLEITQTILSYGVYSVQYFSTAIVLTIVPANPTAIENMSPIASFSLYPTLVSSTLHIDLKMEKNEQVEIKMYASSGAWLRTLWSGRLAGDLKLEEQMEMQPAGIYFITVRSGNSFHSRKIIRM
jgi:hypothetical protein